MTYQSEEAAKKVEQIITGLARFAHKVKFAQAELEHSQAQVIDARKKLKAEQANYDVHLEKVLELFPHLGTGFKDPEPTQTVQVGPDGHVHVVPVPQEFEAS